MTPCGTRESSFSGGFVGTALGSANYHLNPSDGGLAVDRYGMVVAFAGLLGLVAASRISERASHLLVASGLVLGRGAVAFWQSAGSLTPYALVQFGGLFILFPITPATNPPSPTPPRVPAEAEFAFPSGQARVLQVNFCKNPRCPNFGVPATGTKYSRRAKAGAVPGKDYRLVSSGAGLPVLKCLLCSEHLPLKSNQGIVEELARLTQHFQPVQHCCPTEGCSNSAVSAPNSDAYYRFGKTDGGSSRYQCKACKKTFSVSNRATLRQREARKNVPLLQSLVNKAPLARAAEIHGISFQTIHDKLDFFHRQVLQFSAKQETKLRELVKGTKRYIAVDRQDYAVNWTHRKDKRNIVLRAIGSADLESGFVFGMHLNFDGSLDADSVEADALDIRDFDQPRPHRKYARLWLKEDYAKAVAASAAKAAKRSKPTGALADDIQQRYDEAVLRDDVENPEKVSGEQRFPANGMQVRGEYTMYAHFFYLHDLLGGAQKLRFFMDQESGIRAACLAAFEDEIAERRRKNPCNAARLIRPPN